MVQGLNIRRVCWFSVGLVYTKKVLCKRSHISAEDVGQFRARLTRSTHTGHGNAQKRRQLIQSSKRKRDRIVQLVQSPVRCSRDTSFGKDLGAGTFLQSIEARVLGVDHDLSLAYKRRARQVEFEDSLQCQVVLQDSDMANSRFCWLAASLEGERRTQGGWQPSSAVRVWYLEAVPLCLSRNSSSQGGCLSLLLRAS